MGRWGEREMGGMGRDNSVPGCSQSELRRIKFCCKMIKVTKIETPLGEMIAGATREGICLLEYLDRKDFNSGSENIAVMFDDTVKHGSSRYLRALKKQLKEYFKGKRKEFSLPLIIRGTDFQQDVWKELQKIPFGTTRSYLDQATSLHNPKLVRAVANKRYHLDCNYSSLSQGYRLRWRPCRLRGRT
jgi:O6-methylguanine-DNA--protein-cysteine methyltransferase